MSGGQFIGFIAVVMVFGIPIIAIWTEHRRKLMELQLRLRGETDVNTRAAIDALREEVRQLRDTSMQYDLSFDSALQKMDQRMGNIERRVHEMEQQQTVGMR
jgi:hypothetical protein